MNFEKGGNVFALVPTHSWTLSVVDSCQQDKKGKQYTVITKQYHSATGSLKDCEKGTNVKVEKLSETDLYLANMDTINDDVHDLLDLTELHDSTLLRCLFLRYMKDIVYTCIGAIIVAFNPFNYTIPWYKDDYMDRYLQEGEVIQNNLPHSWLLAHNTYYEMRGDGKNQCILVSGESGAGKTVAAKIVMKYLGCVSCLHGEGSEKDDAQSVAHRIQQASPILAAFGNAKTVRNDNSSRFGKFMKVQFNRNGFLVGAYTIKYLLEKSRIVTASQNERIYHSFYLVCRGRDAQQFRCNAPEKYKSCSAGGCTLIENVDDAADYDAVCKAMSEIRISSGDQQAIWAGLSAQLSLLQVNFDEIDLDSCSISAGSNSDLENSVALWKIDKDTLSKELVTTTLKMRGEETIKKLSKVKAIDARDSLVKSLYDSTFSWLVDRVNDVTESKEVETWIGLLDIFGFEDFEYNSFEQICINLANEALQNHYNTYIFSKDMEECRAEGIDVTSVVCPDNSPCLNLMLAKTGIFGALDEECSLGQGSDTSFLAKIIANFEGKNPFFGVKKLSRNSFLVHHYAGTVCYTVDGWLEKNRDTLKDALKTLMRSSACAFTKNLLEEPQEQSTKTTLGSVFKRQLKDLMDLINSTNPHWIRCVKPHPAKRSLHFDAAYTMNQLEASGVLGTVRVRKVGYPIRLVFAKFHARYRIITGQAPSIENTSEFRAWVEKIAQMASLTSMQVQCGTTKVFMKSEAYQILEKTRDSALSLHRRRIQEAAQEKMRDLLIRAQERLKLMQFIQKEFRCGLQRWKQRRSKYDQSLQRGEDPGPVLNWKTGKLMGEVESEEEAVEEVEDDTTDEINPNIACQFSTDRMCTVCDPAYDGSESAPALYICEECDEKLCERCWLMEHRNPKRADHEKKLLFYECSYCTSNQKSPAMFACNACELLLCAQCWYDEHRAPRRQGHRLHFLYPKEFEEKMKQKIVTISGDKFDPRQQFTHFVEKKFPRKCVICLLDAPLYCTVCGDKMCEECWKIEHRNAKRRDHVPRLLLYHCESCRNDECRPAFFHCKECKMYLCAACWGFEHRHPSRKDHNKALLNTFPIDELQSTNAGKITLKLSNEVLKMLNKLKGKRVTTDTLLEQKGEAALNGVDLARVEEELARLIWISQQSQHNTPFHTTGIRMRPPDAQESPFRATHMHSAYPQSRSPTEFEVSNESRMFGTPNRLPKLTFNSPPNNYPMDNATLSRNFTQHHQERDGPAQYQSSMIHPVPQSTSPHDANLRTSSRSQRLPHGWQEAYSNEGIPYYLHVSGRRQWVLPQ